MVAIPPNRAGMGRAVWARRQVALACVVCAAGGWVGLSWRADVTLSGVAGAWSSFGRGALDPRPGFASDSGGR